MRSFIVFSVSITSWAFLCAAARLLLGVNGFQHGGHGTHFAVGHMGEDITIKMHHATLPIGLRKHLCQGVNQSQARIRDDQSDPTQSPFLKLFKKRLPAGFILPMPSTTPTMRRQPSWSTPMAARTETFFTSPPQLRFSTMPSRYT